MAFVISAVSKAISASRILDRDADKFSATLVRLEIVDSSRLWIAPSSPRMLSTSWMARSIAPIAVFELAWSETSPAAAPLAAKSDAIVLQLCSGRW